MPTDRESYETTNQESTSRGKVAHQYPAGSRKPPRYSHDSSFSAGTEHHMDEQRAVKSNQHGDGTGSGTPDD